MREQIHFVQQIIEGDKERSSEHILMDIAYAVGKSAILAITDEKGVIQFANDEFVNISKYTLEELIGSTHSLLNSGYHSKAFMKAMWSTIGKGQVWSGELCNRDKEGELYWVDTVIVPFLNESGKPYQYIAIRWDITEKKQMEQEIKDTSELYRLITENASDYIVVFDKEFDLKYTSPSFQNVLEINHQAIKKSSFLDLVKESHRGPFIERSRQVSGDTPFEFLLVTSNQKEVMMEGRIRPIEDDGIYSGNLILVMQDITERKATEDKILDLAINDQLTTLYNRTTFRRQLFSKIEQAKVNHTKLALVYINIDRFRYVNDSLGHLAGDQILTTIATRLKEVLNETDIVGRISGDEFAFALSNDTQEEQIVETVESIRLFLEQPILIQGEPYELSISSGVSFFPNHTNSAADLVTRAEKALHESKISGGGKLSVYRSGTVTKTLERILLENELRKSVEKDYFELEFQPKVDLIHNRLSGFEALVRWDHPDLGRISPIKFIPLAEEVKVIIPLGEWIFEESIRQLYEWNQQGYTEIHMAVNFSTIQLEDVGLIPMIKRVLDKYPVNPSDIQMELTESSFAKFDDILPVIEEVRALGLQVAIDDFGTGYSTFSYIKELPVDIVKIDRSFILDLDMNKESQAIVEAIITLASTIGLQVVAEGIETEEQGLLLKELGCHEGQGYYYSRPIPSTECVAFLCDYLPHE